MITVDPPVTINLVKDKIPLEIKDVEFKRIIEELKKYESSTKNLGITFTFKPITGKIDCFFDNYNYESLTKLEYDLGLENTVNNIIRNLKVNLISNSKRYLLEKHHEK